MLMENRKRVLSAMFAAPMLATAITIAAWQEKSAEKPAVAAAKPGAAEMERLEFYLGEWDYKGTDPNEEKNTGVYTSKLGPGGKLLIKAVHFHGPVGDFEGLLVSAWDPKGKMY